MGHVYTIPGYFESCIVKDNEVKEDKFFGKTLYKYSKHELKEARMFGSTVLVFKKGGIYEPGLFGSCLFKVTERGEVKENKIFGRTVGAIPPEWMDGFEPEIEPVPNTSYKNEIKANSYEEKSVEKEESLEEFAEKMDIENGWVADFSNVKVGAETISCPKKYHSIIAIAPALSRNGLKNIKIHAGVVYIKTSNVHGYNFFVDAENPNYCSENGVLYSKDKTILYSVPEDCDFSFFQIPASVKTIESHAFWFSVVENITIPNGVEKISDSAFGYNKKLKTIFIPNTVSKIAANAFVESKKVIISTSFTEKPLSWELDVTTLKGINWGRKE